MHTPLELVCRQPDRTSRPAPRRSRRKDLSLGDLVALLHERALDRGLTEDEAAAATARGIAAALSRCPDRHRLIDELCRSADLS
jgi:hypothetical protein